MTKPFKVGTMTDTLSEDILTAEARARLADVQGRTLAAKKLWETADVLRALWCKENMA